MKAELKLESERGIKRERRSSVLGIDEEDSDIEIVSSRTKRQRLSESGPQPGQEVVELD